MCSHCQTWAMPSRSVMLTSPSTSSPTRQLTRATGWATCRSTSPGLPHHVCMCVCISAGLNVANRVLEIRMKGFRLESRKVLD